jgi:hypothetical protein
MKPSVEVGALVLLALLPAARAQREGSAPVAQAPAPRKAPNIADPGAGVALRLLQMTPEQRDRALEKFPPERQAQIRESLERLDSLPPPQKQRRIREYQIFASLPPEKQILVRRQIQAFNRLPEERKRVVGIEMQKLRQLPESQREARLASEEFKTRFAPSEQQMLGVVSQYLPLE